MLESVKDASNVLRASIKVGKDRNADGIVQSRITFAESINALEAITIRPDEL